jgi:hypothetical protein
MATNTSFVGAVCLWLPRWSNFLGPYLSIRRVRFSGLCSQGTKLTLLVGLKRRYNSELSRRTSIAVPVRLSTDS